jgi:threonine dehydrogenase-like Zn-dependent dehydrogenase
MASDTGNRLEVAAKLSAVPIDFTKGSVADRVMEMTGGLGAKRVLECTGSEKGIVQACNAVAKGGRISIISLPPGDGIIAIPLKKLVLDEVDFVGNRANPNTLEKAIRLWEAQKFDIDGLITHEFTLAEYRTALDIFVGKKENSIKIVVKPNI